MRGHIAKKGDRYYPVVEVRDATGDRRRKWHAGHNTKKAAERALTELLASIDNGTYVERSKVTVAQFLRDTWLPAIGTTIRASTLQGYRLHVEAHITPTIGGLGLQAVTGAVLNGLYTRLLTEPSTRRKDGLKPATVRRVHACLHRAFKDAVRWGYIVRNPADHADPPKLRAAAQPEMKTWTAGEVGSFLRTVQDDRLYAAYVLAATTGMRRGEVLGVRWADIDMDRRRLAVRQTITVVDNELIYGDPKTSRGKRVVALDVSTVAALRAHRARQAEERLAWGGGYEDEGLVFARENGRPLHPNNFSDEFDRHVRASGLPRIRLHDLRHTHITLALAGGVSVKVVSERVGHASTAFTMDQYAHVTPPMAEDAADRVASAIFGS